jgi:hypothetical protein
MRDGIHLPVPTLLKEPRESGILLEVWVCRQVGLGFTQVGDLARSDPTIDKD